MPLRFSLGIRMLLGMPRHAASQPSRPRPRRRAGLACLRLRPCRSLRSGATGMDFAEWEHGQRGSSVLRTSRCGIGARRDAMRRSGIGVQGRVAGGFAGLRGIRRASPRDFVGSEELRRGTSRDQKNFAAGLRGIRRASPRDFVGSEELRRGTSRDFADSSYTPHFKCKADEINVTFFLFFPEPYGKKSSCHVMIHLDNVNLLPEFIQLRQYDITSGLMPCQLFKFLVELFSFGLYNDNTGILHSRLWWQQHYLPLCRLT